jgi:hypothetical protein
MTAYEVRPRKDKRCVDLISDALPFGRLWAAGHTGYPGQERQKCQDFIHGSKSGYRVVGAGTALAPETRGGAGSVFKNPGMTAPEGVPRKI